MPAPDWDWEGLLREAQATWRQTELDLIRLIRDEARRTGSMPQWAVARARQVDRLRREIEELTGSTLEDLTPLLEELIEGAARAGGQRAIWEAREAGAPVGDWPTTLATATQYAVSIILTDTLQRVGAMRPLILRDCLDAYQKVVADAATRVVVGGVTRVQATQAALDEFAAQGITGFMDRAGRRWRMDSYAEMATRTAVIRAHTLGHFDALHELGIHLVRVPQHGYQCPLCDPWAGSILSLDGTPRGHHYVPATTGGQLIPVMVAGTVDDARDAGLWHPNCRHTVAAYLPGTSPDLPALTPRQADPGGYRVTQRQRAMERRLRHWKRMEAAALTEEARAKAVERVQFWEDELDILTMDEGNLRRKPAREQPYGAH